jgi:hypothetical protein
LIAKKPQPISAPFSVSVVSAAIIVPAVIMTHPTFAVCRIAARLCSRRCA